MYIMIYNVVLTFQTTTNQALFRVEAGVCRFFRDYLTSQGFVEIHTPKIISGNVTEVHVQLPKSNFDVGVILIR